MRCCNDAYRLYSFHRYLRLRRRSRCPLRGIHAGLSHALPLLPQSGYMGTAKGTFPPGRLHPHFRRIRSFRGVSCPSKHTSSQEIIPGSTSSPGTPLPELLRGGGGITVSGGEPLLQADFLCEFFQLAKEQHIHTTLDTAGQPFTTAEPFFSRLTTLLEHTDLVILDLKHIDPEKHRLLTGHSNDPFFPLPGF